MSENCRPNKKRRASSSADEQVKRICLHRSSAAASAVSIAANSANASHGSNSNKRAREELSTVPSASNKRARTTTPLLPDRSIEQQLREAAAALIALTQQAQNINKPPANFIDLPGGKRIRIEAPVISSNNNGIGRPRPNSNQRIIIDAPIFGWRPAPTTAPASAPAAPAAPTTASAEASTAAATANKIRGMPSTSILRSNTRKQNKSVSVHFSEICMGQPFDKDSSPENVSYDFEQQVIPMKMSLHDVVEEGQPPEE